MWLTSVLAPRVCPRGLLGVISVALAGLTDKTEWHYATSDRDFFGALASQVGARALIEVQESKWNWIE